MKVLISGGAGFIGRRLAERLVGSGRRVRILDNFYPQVHDDVDAARELAEQWGEVVEGDVRSVDAWRTAIDGCDAIAHLAAETGVGQSQYQVTQTMGVNVGGVAAMIEALVDGAHRVSRVVLASSRAVYGEGKYLCDACGAVSPSGRTPAQLAAGQWEPTCPRCEKPVVVAPTDEATQPHSCSVYAVSKQSQEDLLRAMAPVLGIPAAMVRYTNVYGPHQALSNPYTGILATWLTRVQSGKPLAVYEDGRESRDFVFVDDVAAATAAALESGAEGVFNIGSGEPITLMELAQIIARRAGSPHEPRVTGQYRLGDIRHFVADISAAREQLGYHPRVGIEEGVGRFIDWALRQTVQDKTEQAQAELKARGLLGKVS